MSDIIGFFVAIWQFPTVHPRLWDLAKHLLILYIAFKLYGLAIRLAFRGVTGSVGWVKRKVASAFVSVGRGLLGLNKRASAPVAEGGGERPVAPDAQGNPPR